MSNPMGELPDEERIRITPLIKEFFDDLDKYHKNLVDDFNEYLSDPKPTKLQTIKLKYPHIKKNIRKNTKISTIKKLKTGIYDYMKITDNRPDNERKYSPDEKKEIIKYVVEKIKGIYKHAQAFKTGYCNLQIMNSSSKNQLTFAITKNTLEANQQWIQRILKDLDRRWPMIKTDKKVMIISSKKNTLDGNATHCKNISEAWVRFSSNNDYSVVFICSNNTRMNDVYELIELIPRLSSEYIKEINIIHDEAHNSKEGIPAYRELIENIISKTNVIQYTPCTASNNSICCDDNPLWSKDNLERNSLDYTEYDKTKSSDSNYSSVQDSNLVTFEDLSNNENWTNDTITCVSREEFIKVDPDYKGKKMNDLSEKDIKDIDTRRELEFCQFMKNHKEKQAMNFGLNCLNMNKLLNFEYFQKGKLNLHIISTPLRNIITRKLCIEALRQDYDPIVLGIYGNQGEKYHLMYGKKKYIVDKIMGDGEFNEKIDKLMKYLKKKNVNIDRPFIFIGNYIPTGESLSFVNFKYGIIRGNIRLISTNAEEDYQEACRGNYMTNLFIKNDPNWKQPDKFLIGEKQSIENAIAYEKENDARIDELRKRNNMINDNENTINISLPSNSIQDDNIGIISSPIKIEFDDMGHDKVDQFWEIMKNARRTDQDKKILMGILKECQELDILTIVDHYGKFNFNDFKLKEARCWRKGCSTDVNQWKFKSYQTHHMANTGFMNNSNSHNKNECELCCCLDFYKVTDSKGEIIKNRTNVLWIGYKY